MAFCTSFADQNCAICRTLKLGALPTVAAGSAPAKRKEEYSLFLLLFP